MINIREDKLSEEAKSALKDSKNKSQFVRDAIEYYVSNNMKELNNKSVADILEKLEIISKKIDGSIVNEKIDIVEETKEKDNIVILDNTQESESIINNNNNTKIIGDNLKSFVSKKDVSENDEDDENDDLISKALDNFM